MRRIAPLVADLFVRHGLTVEVASEGPHPVALTVRDGNNLLLVGGDLSGAPVDNLTIAAFLAACHDANAAGVYVHEGHLTPAAVRLAADTIHLWSLDTLVHLVGQTEVATHLERPLPALPGPRMASAAVDLVEELALEASRPPVSEPDAMVIDLPPSAAEDIPDLTEEAPVEPFIELADDTPILHLEDADGSLAQVEPGSASDAEAPDVIDLTDIAPIEAAQPVDVLAEEQFEVPAVEDLMPAAFRDGAAAEPATESPALDLPVAFASEEREPVRAPDGSQGLLPPRVTLAEAKAMVADRLFSIEEAELILQPVHVFDFQVDLLSPGKLTAAPVRGRLQVNGTDRRVTATDPAKANPRLAHRVFNDDALTVMDKVLRVSPDRAHQLATAWATTEHAKTVRLTTSRSDDAFEATEARAVAPTSSQVHLTALGLWHRPFWRLWGDNGHIDVDAVEGHVLDAEIKTPNPDFLLVE